MKPIKIICISSLAMLLNLASSNESTSSTNSDQITGTDLLSSTDSYPPLHDTSYSVNKDISVDSIAIGYDFFKKLNAVKVVYKNKRIDWCARYKTYTLFDKNDKYIITFGIEGYNLFASKYEFDNLAQIEENNNVFNKSYQSYENVECFYDSDSLLLQTIIPSLETQLFNK